MLIFHTQICSTSEPWLALPLLWESPLGNIKISKKVPFNGKWTESAIKSSLYDN